MKRLSWFIARRYLAARKGGWYLSFITLVSLGGVTVGVMALVVVIGVMTGMQDDVRERILDATPHVFVFEYQSQTSLRMDDWEEVLDSVRQVEGVVGAAPFLLTKVALRRDEYAQVGDLYGVSLENSDMAVTGLDDEIYRGIHSLETTESGLSPLLVGARLAERMQLFKGDTVILIGLENFRTDPFGNLSPSIRNFEISGTFQTGLYDFDVGNLYARLADVQDLLGIQEIGQVSGLGIRTTDPWLADDIGDDIVAHLGLHYYVQSWMTTNQALFSALKLEKLAMALILFLIVVVAAFNIVSTLVMVVVERTREIGILKAIGMADRQVLRVFMLQGVWIGVIGTVLGTASGCALAIALDRYDLIQIPPDIYLLDHLPVNLNPLDVAIIALASIVVSVAATVYPAIQASRLDPVEAIRHE
ncbi:MAG: ABC transporter permease [Gemmatimonadetes bacterium]|nr:ABC transporter permease [Gemmatimonadota bacterium]